MVMRPFDALPFSFDTETFEEINKAHVKIQNEGMPNLAILQYSDTFRLDVIESLLHQIVEFPENDNSSIVLRLAAHTAEWAEAKLARRSMADY